ncbi:MAG: nucleoside recognition domain-containing protein, partial [Candidatus Marinimicrobia bacterium]|nr:nucleoside recognition domain-containing protein [Candidatus Neomarinimicrobiota bacterium]
MVLNIIWISFFVIAWLVGLGRLIFLGDTQIFPELINSTFDMAKMGLEISLGLAGIMTLWLGLMKIAEKSGCIQLLAKAVNPLFSRLFPGIPAGHPAYGSMLMNIAANMLGLENAATPLGLKAMKQLQDLNTEKDTATDAMIMFLVMNTSGLMILPVSIMMYRSEMGATNPADIFIPILIATFISTLCGILVVAFRQKIRIWDKVLLAYLGGFLAIIVGIIAFFSTLSPEMINIVSLIVGNLILFTVIVFFIGMGFRKKLNVYEVFIDGAKEGFKTAIMIIPYLIAILVAVGVFRTSGALDMFIGLLGKGFSAIGINTDFLPALPTAFMRPLSGSGARGLMIEAMKHYGADSFVGRLVCIMQGATDTTFYIIALYFGSVGIRKTRYAVSAGLMADFAGII